MFDINCLFVKHFQLPKILMFWMVGLHILYFVWIKVLGNDLQPIEMPVLLSFSALSTAKLLTVCVYSTHPISQGDSCMLVRRNLNFWMMNQSARFRFINLSFFFFKRGCWLLTDLCDQIHCFMLVIEFTICFGDRIHALRKIVVFQSYILIFADKLVGYLISFINKTKDFLYHWLK